ncbi:MAG: IMP cyclohydrolase [Planctomycetaceae bacterium]|nr:IMP cyclohydrolase [Planctomycetaceae bacterium]
MGQIYLGRIVAVGITPSGKAAALYRVSSRSFPNRMAQLSAGGKCIAIIPKSGFEKDIARSPYIAYNAARLVGPYAVLTNGSHTDPVAEKLAMGLPPRDAIALTLLAMDYEKDDFNTPRIVAVAQTDSSIGWLGSVREDGIDVRSFELKPGQIAHLSTYEHNIPTKCRIGDFDAESADEACRYILDGGHFADFTNAITAVAAVAEGGEFTLASRDVKV